MMTYSIKNKKIIIVTMIITIMALFRPINANANSSWFSSKIEYKRNRFTISGKISEKDPSRTIEFLDIDGKPLKTITVKVGDDLSKNDEIPKSYEIEPKKDRVSFWSIDDDTDIKKIGVVKEDFPKKIAAKPIREVVFTTKNEINDITGNFLHSSSSGSRWTRYGSIKEIEIKKEFISVNSMQTDKLTFILNGEETVYTAKDLEKPKVIQYKVDKPTVVQYKHDIQSTLRFKIVGDKVMGFADGYSQDSLIDKEQFAFTEYLNNEKGEPVQVKSFDANSFNGKFTSPMKLLSIRNQNSIGEYAFANNHIEKIELKSAQIGGGAFRNSNIKYLNSDDSFEITTQTMVSNHGFADNKIENLHLNGVNGIGNYAREMFMGNDINRVEITPAKTSERNKEVYILSNAPEIELVINDSERLTKMNQTEYSIQVDGITLIFATDEYKEFMTSYKNSRPIELRYNHDGRDIVSGPIYLGEKTPTQIVNMTKFPNFNNEYQVEVDGKVETRSIPFVSGLIPEIKASTDGFEHSSIFKYATPNIGGKNFTSDQFKRVNISSTGSETIVGYNKLSEPMKTTDNVKLVFDTLGFNRTYTIKGVDGEELFTGIAKLGETLFSSILPKKDEAKITYFNKFIPGTWKLENGTKIDPNSKFGLDMGDNIVIIPDDYTFPISSKIWLDDELLNPNHYNTAITKVGAPAIFTIQWGAGPNPLYIESAAIYQNGEMIDQFSLGLPAGTIPIEFNHKFYKGSEIEIKVKTAKLSDKQIIPIYSTNDFSEVGQLTLPTSDSVLIQQHGLYGDNNGMFVITDFGRYTITPGGMNGLDVIDKATGRIVEKIPLNKITDIKPLNTMKYRYKLNVD